MIPVRSNRAGIICLSEQEASAHIEVARGGDDIAG